MTGRDRVQFRDRKRTGQAVVALAADTIHAIYFDALSNPVETNPRNNVASLFFFLPFFLPPPSIPPSLLPQPSFPSNRSSREKLSHPSFSHRWTVFLARRKIPPPRKKERPRTENRLLSPRSEIFSVYSLEFQFDSSGDEVYPVFEPDVCGGRTSLKRTKRLNLYLPRSRGKDGVVIFRTGVYEHTRPDLLVRSRRINTTRAPSRFARLLISVSSMCADLKN